MQPSFVVHSGFDNGSSLSFGGNHDNLFCFLRQMFTRKQVVKATVTAVIGAITVDIILIFRFLCVFVNFQISILSGFLCLHNQRRAKHSQEKNLFSDL